MTLLLRHNCFFVEFTQKQTCCFTQNSGYTQKELAEKVGVNLRTLQQYEIRAKDINKAAGTTLLALSKVLGCRVEDLLEYDSSEIDDEE